MVKEFPVHYRGTTRPGAVGWTRIGVSALAALLLMGWAFLAAPNPGAAAFGAFSAVVFVLIAVWQWMRLWTTFVVDENGLTVSFGGFWKQTPWPLRDFRTVQLREVPPELLGSTMGGVGWRRGAMMTPTVESLTTVGDRKPYTFPEPRASYRVLISRAGTLVEIIGRENLHYVISADDPRATATAIDQAIRARR